MGLDRQQDEFVSRYYKEMYQQLMVYARSSLSNPSLAEEAVQDTFRIACAKIDDFMSSPNPQGWLVLVLRNVIRNIRRELASLSKIIVSSMSIEDEVFIDSHAVRPNVSERIEDLEIDILYSDLLSPDEYKLLKLIAIHKYSMLEASQELGISVEACKKRVQRAKEKLRKILEKE